MSAWNYSVTCAFCGEGFQGPEADIVAAQCWNHECVRCKTAPKAHMPDLETITRRMKTTTNPPPPARTADGQML